MTSFPYSIRVVRAHFAHLLIVTLNKQGRNLKVQYLKLGVVFPAQFDSTFCTL
jgi:hypothetical protein